MPRKSAIDRLDPAIRSAVLAAIEEGASIDDITDLVRGMGGEASRSSVGRYAQKFAAISKRQREMRAVAEGFGREFGGADDLQGRMMIQLMTSAITRSVMALDEEEAEEAPNGLELSRLAKAVKDATSASKIDIEREAKIREETAKRERAAAADRAESAGRAAGASEDSLRAVRMGILGLSA